MSVAEQAEQALRVVREAPLIAYDTETSGVNWRKNATVGYVINSGDFGAYIPIRHGGGGNIAGGVPLESAELDHMPEPHPWEKELAKAFLDRRRLGLLTVGHNLAFDLHFSANHGVMLGRCLGDTMLNEAIINELAPGFGLDACCRRYGVTAKKGDALYGRIAGLFGGEPDRNQMAHYWKLAGDDPVAVDYALGDGVSTLELWHAQMKLIEEVDPADKKSLKAVHELESELLWTTFRMERRGIRIDEARLAEVRDEVARLVAEKQKEFPEGFNARATADCKKWLEAQGFTDFPRTEPTPRFPEGQVSLRQKWLEKLPEAKSIIELRNLLDLDSKFLGPLQTTHVWRGRVHATLNQLKGDEWGTISGRYSCTNPNLQQLTSRNKKLGRMLRQVYVADPGMVFLESDMSQAEPRLFAHYTRSQMLIDGYNAVPFKDLHTVMSERLGMVRDLAKRVNMALLTGQSLGGFARHMEWEMERAKPVYNDYFQEFPELRKFHNDATKVFRSRGFVRSLLGRRFHLSRSDLAYQAVSRIIQGGNADIMKYYMLRADKMVEEDGDVMHLLMTVHDSLVAQHPDTPHYVAFSDELVHQFERVQEVPFKLRVPFVMETGRGANWGEAKFGPAK